MVIPAAQLQWCPCSRLGSTNGTPPGFLSMFGLQVSDLRFGPYLLVLKDEWGREYCFCNWAYIYIYVYEDFAQKMSILGPHVLN